MQSFIGSIPGAGDISEHIESRYDIASDLISKIRTSVIEAIENVEDADPWDEYRAGVDWIHNELYSDGLDNEELNNIEYITETETVIETIRRLSLSPFLYVFKKRIEENN